MQFKLDRTAFSVCSHRGEEKSKVFMEAKKLTSGRYKDLDDIEKPSKQ